MQIVVLGRSYSPFHTGAMMSSKKYAILLCYQGLLDMEDSEKLENFMSCMGHACKCSFCLEEVTNLQLL